MSQHWKPNIPWLTRRLMWLGALTVTLCVLGSAVQRTPEGDTALERSDAAGDTAPVPDTADGDALVMAYKNLSLGFEANVGQTDPTIAYVARGPGYNVFLTEQGAALALSKRSGPRLRPESTASEGDSLDVDTHVLQIVPEFGQAQELQPEGPQEGTVSYLMGEGPQDWHVDVPTYRRIVARDVQPGVDVVYYGRQGRLEYDVVLAPGVDPSGLTFRIEGGVLETGPSGNLLIKTPLGDVEQLAPVAYQDGPAGRETVDGDYQLLDEQRFAFAVGPYDADRTLVIDPVIEYATYLGGAGHDIAEGVTVDSSGHAYVTGLGLSPDFPITNGAMTLGDGFVTKFAPDGGSHVYSAHVDLTGYGVAVDGSGNAWVAGRDYLGKVIKINATGTGLLGSIDLGTWATDVDLDDDGNAYVTGETDSQSFTTTPGVFQPNYGGSHRDVFVAKLDTNVTMVWGTFLGGGLGGGGSDYGRAVKVDGNDEVFVSGFTYSVDYPVRDPYQLHKAGSYDAFLTKLNSTATDLVFSTYLGGSSRDQGYDMAIDADGSAYVVGHTESWNDFPLQNPYQGNIGGALDAFVTKFAPDGQSLEYSTFLGGGFEDYIYGVAVGADESVTVAGRTNSNDFPMVAAPQGYLTGGMDGFAAKLNATGSALDWSTYLGAVLTDEAFDVALDSNGDAYVIGWTSSYELNTQAPLQAQNGGDWQHHDDAFLVKILNSGAAGPEADVRMSMTDDPDPVQPNGILTYVATVTNDGPDSAQNVGARFRLDVGSDIVSVTPNQGSCTWPVDIHMAVCSLGAIASGSTATVTIEIQVPNVQSGTVFSDGFMSADAWDPDIRNNRTGNIVTTISGTPLPTNTPTTAPTNTPAPTSTPGPTNTPAPDTVVITRAEYDAGKGELKVEAESTSSTAVLTVYKTDGMVVIGTLDNEGDGRYRGEFEWEPNPENITVTSSQGGSDSSDVD